MGISCVEGTIATKEKTVCREGMRPKDRILRIASKLKERKYPITEKKGHERLVPTVQCTERQGL